MHPLEYDDRKELPKPRSVSPQTDSAMPSLQATCALTRRAFLSRHAGCLGGLAVTQVLAEEAMAAAHNPLAAKEPELVPDRPGRSRCIDDHRPDTPNWSTLDRMGARVDQFGDSEGRLTGLEG